MEPPEIAVVQARETLQTVFTQIRLARAAEMARSKRYLEAEGLLAPGGRLPKDPVALDLLARVAAQQRQFDRARQLWQAALEQSPGNADYERAIACTKAVEQRQLRWRSVSLCAFLGLLIAVGWISWIKLPKPAVGGGQQSMAGSANPGKVESAPAPEKPRDPHATPKVVVPPEAPSSTPLPGGSAVPDSSIRPLAPEPGSPPPAPTGPAGTADPAAANPSPEIPKTDGLSNE